MFIFMLLVIGLSVTVLADAQIACSGIGGGTVICNSPSGSTSITDFSRGQGIITQHGRDGSSSMEPYTIIGQDRHRRASGIEPLKRLERLPSSSSHDSGYSSSRLTPVSPIYGATTMDSERRSRSYSSGLSDEPLNSFRSRGGSLDDPLGLDR